MASLSFFIGIIGNVISILVFACPIKTFWRIVKKKSTENYKGVPYITTLMSTSLWTFYGILKPGGLLVATVNGAGAVFQFIYVTLFLIYAPKDKKVKTAKLVGIFNVGFVGVVIAITLLAMHGKMRLTFVGILCAALTIGMYASPLAVMTTVIATKSVKYMPFLLSFFLFLNAGVWSAYAVLVKDIYIGIPNAIGFVLGSAQLILYMIYKNKSTKPTDTIRETGSTLPVKEGIEMRAHVDDDHGVQGDGKDDEEAIVVEKRSLSKQGKSLPKPTLSKQYSLPKILKKTASLGPYDLYSSWYHHYDTDVQTGNNI
ncbi:Bidirectional sugar transporter SWEET [Melia azedarach]|uniref:Bidirectional sugar transporter SWEET n=1 Tax=Melia azedarach TaxID=155640 RepID=A0ACC1Y7N2_MELAZ|nr:Bidirectional sugar transporter SWEET [Melia azedarach]